ncbi:MAG: hypothetical protein DRI37_05000 [Chloroflexi bacterium]|nr:MAG: hypothetical protein DRI37_05000 [Chloroflexota bacterium]
MGLCSRIRRWWYWCCHRQFWQGVWEGFQEGYAHALMDMGVKEEVAVSRALAAATAYLEAVK